MQSNSQSADMAEDELGSCELILTNLALSAPVVGVFIVDLFRLEVGNRPAADFKSI